ncbi:MULTISPECIES: tetratricopeptide repeat protein [unclassified Rhizobium]|jgi:Flp pilus assembly protein TadD|uniref:tetratricopeptide repeat protein n=1 Tax=Rhizobium sp. BG4 TaxID=2613770 RepID=UPI000DD56C44|nr:tetratricopeptide repeat protein [Rhizobium sp. BG4]QRM44326.1 tetratricopeptide repeat protein [Rhizobium sp. BG4]
MKRSFTSYAVLGVMGFCALSAAGSAMSALTAMPAYAVDNMETGDGPDLTSVRAKIAAKDYQAALTELRGLAEDNQQADVYNLLGYTLRMTGDYETSLTYYTKALELQPDHKAAHEYLGELYLQTGKPDKANEQLASLKQLCPAGCEELEDLQEAIAARGGN